jgi:hypothetical protein
VLRSGRCSRRRCAAGAVRSKRASSPGAVKVSSARGSTNCVPCGVMPRTRSRTVLRRSWIVGSGVRRRKGISRSGSSTSGAASGWNTANTNGTWPSDWRETSASRRRPRELIEGGSPQADARVQEKRDVDVFFCELAHRIQRRLEEPLVFLKKNAFANAVVLPHPQRPRAQVTRLDDLLLVPSIEPHRLLGPSYQDGVRIEAGSHSRSIDRPSLSQARIPPSKNATGRPCSFNRSASSFVLSPARQ